MSIEKVKKAIEKGNVELSERVEEALFNMDLNNPDFTLTEVDLECCWGPFKDNKGGFSFDWMSKSAGCGRVTFHIANDGSLHCYNQGMSREFIKDVFVKFLEQVELE